MQLFVHKQVEKFCNDNDIEFQNIDETTKLIGSDSIFDSMELVTFLVELEEGLEEEFSIEIDIAEEKAMSRFRSPFLNTTTLSQYIIDRINEED